MRLQLDSFGAIKNYIHVFQGVVLFLAWALTITIFTRDGTNDGRIGWYFGLCWLTIPILIYLTMVPMWSRARKFANVYAFAALDAASVVLWLSAWASVASYVSEGKSKGKEDNNEGKSGCDNFGFGSPGRCNLSTGVTILGVFLMLAFCATAYISFRAVMAFKRTGVMHTSYNAKQDNFSAQTQEAFSSNMGRDEFDDDDVPGGLDGRQGKYAYPSATAAQDEAYAPIYQNDHHEDDMAQIPTSPLASGGFVGVTHQFNDTSYGGAAGRVEMPEAPSGYRGLV